MLLWFYLRSKPKPAQPFGVGLVGEVTARHQGAGM